MSKDFVYFVEDTDTSFVLNDLRHIARGYDRIFLFSTEQIENKNELPKNTIVFDQFVDWKNMHLVWVLLTNVFSIVTTYILECIALRKVLPLKASVALLCSNFYKAEQCINILRKVKDFDTSAPFYAFWFYDCIYLARLAESGKAKKVYVRAHGGDLFEERSSLNGKVLFRNYQLKNINKVYSVSEAGTKYLQNKYQRYKHKIETAYLGSPSHDYLNPINTDERFVIVSCASVRNIKRIHKIAEMLHFIDFPVTWYHIGNENLQSKKDKTIPLYIENIKNLPSNIRYVPKGNMSNDEVFSFYRDVPINLFISLSEAEGVPVSMMEAISFGIPVLSTDVGGCREIVTESTGILIPLETEMKDIAKVISEFKISHKNTTEYRSNVRLFWENKFDVKNTRLKI